MLFCHSSRHEAAVNRRHVEAQVTSLLPPAPLAGSFPHHHTPDGLYLVSYYSIQQWIVYVNHILNPASDASNKEHRLHSLHHPPVPGHEGCRRHVPPDSSTDQPIL
jgi:hypothetical protein